MHYAAKIIASAALAGTLAAPAFADAHMDLNSMPCEMYNELSGADRDKVAIMAIAELDTNATATDGTATATDSSVGTEAEESEMAASEGSANATTIANADNDMSVYAEEIRVLNRTCSRNWDAMVLDAAAGQSGTR